ncbi:MAG: M48 family metallopeptidase [Dehalococcoidaceae bacterium]|nr:M48 family metallopeptidase [Dehalococcoidaceae bacterium]
MWEQIRSNQMRSVVLAVSMGLVLLGLGYGLGFYFLDNGIAGMLFALVLWLIMNMVAFFQGDNILLALSGARKIGPSDHPRLYNIVEEMKIASGLEKMPDVYIIDDPAMNAFAIGRDKNKSAVAITAGLLSKLNRDELQGVIAHEMAHIKNRDVLLQVFTSVMLGTIVILSWYASRFMLFGGMGSSRRSSSSGGGAGQAIVIIVAIVLVILAPIFAQLIYFAISRKREYLADASGAAYTRYPEGLASALEKIASSAEQLKSANQATAPMYIMNPFRQKGKPAVNLTSTHPPVSERVRILRSMGGATFSDYNKAYDQVHKGGGSIIPASAGLVSPKSGLKPSHDRNTGVLEDSSGEIQRTRETSDVLWKLNKYKTINCKCGTRLRIPPGFKGTQVKCPHCGNVNNIQ